MIRLLRNIAEWALPTFALAYRMRRDQRAASVPVETPYGFKVACPPAAAAGAWFVQQVKSGRYEAEESALFLTLAKRASVCIDIGANLGWFTCLAASQGLRVVAFEPSQWNLTFLYSTLAYNDFPDVEVYPLALTQEPGLMKLYGQGAVSSLLAGWHGSKQVSTTLVPTTTLDLTVAQRFAGQPLVIKVDVEGFEWEVLNGARKVLALDPKPIWLVEIQLNEEGTGVLNKHFADIFALFWSHGYRATVANSERRVVNREDVARWVANGKPDFGSINYVFEAAQ